MSTKRAWDVLTFDCYGTLIDWEGGIGGAFEAAAALAGILLNREQAAIEYARLEPGVEAAPFQSYRSVLTTSATLTARSLGWNLDERSAKFLPRSLPQWPPFPDTNPALVRLKASGMKLGILSNVDDDLLRETLKHFPVEFDFTITAEQVGSYKPGQGHFEAARQKIGQARWLHCAQSYYHDVEPAVALGIPVAWINRKHESPSGTARPDLEFENLSQLASHLA